MIRVRHIVGWLILLFYGDTYASILKKEEPTVVRTPEERFAELPKLGYPWSPQYLNLHIPGLPELRLHYIDEG